MFCQVWQTALFSDRTVFCQVWQTALFSDRTVFCQVWQTALFSDRTVFCLVRLAPCLAGGRWHRCGRNFCLLTGGNDVLRSAVAKCSQTSCLAIRELYFWTELFGYWRTLCYSHHLSGIDKLVFRETDVVHRPVKLCQMLTDAF